MTIQALLDAAAMLRKTKEEFLIATVVDVRGSAYRRPGARMLVTRQRWVAGSVSGGCLEGDIVHKGFWRIENGKPVVITYDARDDEDASGCNGAIDILIEPAQLGELDPLRLIARARDMQRPVTLATVIRTRRRDIAVGARVALVDSVVRGTLEHAAVHDAMRAATKTRVVECGDVDVLVEVILPPPRLFLLGAGHDAVPLAHQASAVGWDVFVCLPHARPMARERFRGVTGFVFGNPADITAVIDTSHRAVAVVMNHHYDHDRASVGALIASHATYIGVLGPRHRTAKMLAELGITGDARLHAPVGLALGAETPEEIALAIVAEVQAVLTEAVAARLREQRGPIHPAPGIERAVT
jgi:xanthine/CO dehydrogenase XdhC/CoxF family maturation factor